jgi:hypothetical protein
MHALAQLGVGRTAWIPYAKDSQRCLVAALDQWLELSGIGRVPVFRWVSRRDQDRLWPQLACGLLHGGCARGEAPWQIREQTGHKSGVMLAKYIRAEHQAQDPELAVSKRNDAGFQLGSLQRHGMPHLHSVEFENEFAGPTT